MDTIYIIFIMLCVALVAAYHVEPVRRFRAKKHSKSDHTWGGLLDDDRMPIASRSDNRVLASDLLPAQLQAVVYENKDVYGVRDMPSATDWTCIPAFSCEELGI